MNSWPDVTFGGSHEPYVDRVQDESLYITRPKTVAAYGTVQRYPWSLVLFKKQGDPEDEREVGSRYEPKPDRFEFFLGGTPGLLGARGLGGGGGEISLREGAHIDTTAQTWPTSPPVIGYVIFTGDEVDAVRVSPDKAESRTVDVHRHLDGFPKFCVFFPPFAAPGSIEAVDASGDVLHRRELIYGRVTVGAIFGGGD